jgi:hypothetical protein
MTLTYRLNEFRWVFLLLVLCSAVTARGQVAGAGASAPPAIAPAASGNDSAASASEAGTLPAGMTLTCQFYTGPRTGQIRDLAGVASPARIGSLCSDGGSSAGIAIAPSTSDSAANSPDHGAETNGVGAGQGRSTICQFMSGPKAHGWHDYAPVPPLALGQSCQDGANSAGIVVVSGHGQQY